MVESFFEHSFWSVLILQNTLREYAIAVLVFAALITLFRLWYVVLTQKIARYTADSKNTLDDVSILILRSIGYPLYLVISLFVASQSLFLPGILKSALTLILFGAIIFQAAHTVGIFIDVVLRRRFSSDEAKVRGVGDMLKRIATILLWVVGGILALSNVGIEVNSLVATLGIGGIAVAFALQSILSDLFSSFAIYFDKPFSVGDFIVVGDKMGVVKRIGIKTTRVQALQGEELVFSNRDLTSLPIQNFKEMRVRRATFTFGLHAATSGETLREVPAKVKSIIESKEKVRFERAHLKSFTGSAMEYEAAYYIDSADYNAYMDIQESVNLDLIEYFREENIQLAQPISTVLVHQIKQK